MLDNIMKKIVSSPYAKHVFTWVSSASEVSVFSYKQNYQRWKKQNLSGRGCKLSCANRVGLLRHECPWQVVDVAGRGVPIHCQDWLSPHCQGQKGLKLRLSEWSWFKCHSFGRCQRMHLILLGFYWCWIRLCQKGKKFHQDGSSKLQRTQKWIGWKASPPSDRI